MQNSTLRAPLAWRGSLLSVFPAALRAATRLGTLTRRPVPVPVVRAGLGLVFGVGLFAALSLEWPLVVAAAPAAEPVHWVADRDANELVGLDGAHFVQARVTLRSPVRLATAPGGVWVVAAVEGSPIGRHALFRVETGGRLVGVHGGADLGPLFDLEASPSGAALAVEFGLMGQPTRILRVGPGKPGGGGPAWPGGVMAVVDHPGALAVMGELEAGAGPGQELLEHMLVGDEFGRLTRYDLAGSQLSAVVLGGQLGDLAPGPGGRIFALDVAGPGRVLCLSAALELLWSVDSGLSTESFSVVPGEERLWLVDSTEPLARRYGPGGVLELEVTLPSSDASAVLALSDGGALVTVPGALLHIGPTGALLPGQGGFDYLTDIAPGG